MKLLGKPLLAGLLLAATAICFCISPFGRHVEEEYGLTLLFKLRGPRPPPDNAIIINIDDTSGNKPGAPSHFSKWPRTMYADLVDTLTYYGARVIIFDVLFAEKKNQSEDQRFAEALQRAGNVILAEELQHRTHTTAAADNISFDIEVEQLLPPIEVLANSALALAPFPLPKIPVRVTQTWRFKSSCGEIPILPATAYQAAHMEIYNELRRRLSLLIPDIATQLPTTAEQAITDIGLTETMRRIRCIFLERPGLAEHLITMGENGVSTAASQRREKILITLVNMYGGPDRSLIDFYGPPFSITTVSYHDVMTTDVEPPFDAAEMFNGKAVFIGAARNSWSQQKDGFYTVFSQDNGLDISGVELAATIYTNISENRTIHPLHIGITMVFITFLAMTASFLCFQVPPLFSALLLPAGSAVFLFAAHFLFSLDGTWIPVITPLVLLPFIAYITITVANYLSTRRQHRNMSTALSFYLPDNAVRELSRDLSFISKGEQMVYSTCLITDAQNFTALSERMNPAELSRHLKKYFQMIFAEVKDAKGIVCNIIGDSMLAHWPSAAPDAEQSARACRAALQIAAAVQLFNHEHGKNALPTRIGLHCGFILMDNIGAEDHFEYAPVGDIVNTVSRIEGLNKHLSTRILASAEVVNRVKEVESREIGSFLLGGKNQAVTIFELLTQEEQDQSRDRLYRHAFPRALSLFRAGKWQEAQAGFRQCLALDGGDGPSLFYINLCRSYLDKPPSPDWQGDITVEK